MGWEIWKYRRGNLQSYTSVTLSMLKALSTMKIWFGYFLAHKSFFRLKFKFPCVAFKARHSFSSIYNTSSVLFPAASPHTPYLSTVFSESFYFFFSPGFIVSLFASFSACNFTSFLTWVNISLPFFFFFLIRIFQGYVWGAFLFVFTFMQFILLDP